MNEPPNRRDLPKFPLLKLPFLAMENAVKQMAVMDTYKLSKSSRVCKNLVKLMKLKAKDLNVNVNDKWSSVHVVPIHAGVTTLFPMQYFFSKEEYVLPVKEYEGPRENHVVHDHLDGCLDMAEHMNQIFEMKDCNCGFSLPIKSTEETINLLSRVIEMNCTFITISGRSFVKDRKRFDEVIDKRILDYLMDNLNLNAGINMNALLPANYNHENLFKFQCFFNSNASWVTMEMLKSLRNAKIIGFINMNFNSKDMNEFISYFTNCEEDMIEEIKMCMNGESTFREDEVLDQLTTLRVDPRFGSQYHLMKVRHPKTRKRTLIKLRVDETKKSIHLETIEAAEQYQVQLEILELMEKAKDLERELKETEEHELMERKQAIQLELAEIRMKLLVLQN